MTPAALPPDDPSRALTLADPDDPVSGRTAPAPELDAAAMGERMGRAKAAAARYGVDMMM